jgi:hypothetical protein
MTGDKSPVTENTIKRKLPENLIYVFLWLIFLSLPFMSGEYGRKGWFVRICYDWLRMAPFVIVFIANNFWLLPSFLLRGKRIIYIASIILFIGSVSASFHFLSPVLYSNDPRITEQRILQDPAYGREEMSPNKIPGSQNLPVTPGYVATPSEKSLAQNRALTSPGQTIFVLINTILISLLVAGFNTAIAVTNRWFAEEQRRKEIEKEHIKSELAFLQNQVSPHFFMNTLNNIHSLIEGDQAMAQEAVLKLSEMMRYLLYESGRGTTTLKKEIEFLHSYVELMQLRVDKSVDVKIELPGDYKNVNIPPLLFISFIENAFKHGVSYREHSAMSFRLIQHPGSIEFIAENTIPGFRNQASSQHHSGIGLTNIRKRLAMLYGDKHELEISRSDNNFKVRLRIPT